MILLVASALAATLLGWRARRRGWQEGWSADGAVAAGYMLASILFHWRFWLLPGTTMPKGGGDLASFLYPTYRFAADSIQRGVFPLWNPHLFAGAPFAADLQSGIYYPPNVVAFLLARPFEYEALVTLAALHYPLAALCAYALGRQLSLPRLPAFASGLAFAFGGFMVAHLGHYNMLAAASWSPLAIALLLRAQRGHWTWTGPAAGAYALVLLAGHTQVALYTALALALVWLIARRNLSALALQLGLGASAAAVLLVPALELTRLSIRSDITYAQAAEFAASPLGLVTFLVPQSFGDSPRDYWGLRWSLQEAYGYVGVSGLVLAVVALSLPRRDKRALVLALLGLFALLLALGETTPLHGYLYRFVPGFDKVRAPGRALLFVDLAASMLIGLGLAALSRPAGWRERAVGRGLLRALAAVGALAALFIAPLFYYAALTSQDKDPAILRRVTTAAASLNLSLLFFGGAVVLLALWLRRRPVGPLFAGLLALDLVVASAAFNPTSEDVLVGYRHPELIAFLADKPGRVDTRTGVADKLQPDAALLYGLRDVAGLFNPLTLRSFDSYWERLGSRTVPGYDLLGARYVVARRDAPLEAGRFNRVFEAPSELAVFENASALPLAFVAPRWEQMDEASTTTRLREAGFDPRALAIVEGRGAVGSGGTVERFERRSPNAIQIALRDVGGGTLVVSEAHYPGWSAHVDGRSTEVLRAYNALMAVPLPAGAREARLEFRPRFWTTALAVTVGTWLLIAVGAVAAIRSSRWR